MSLPESFAWVHEEQIMKHVERLSTRLRSAEIQNELGPSLSMNYWKVSSSVGFGFPLTLSMHMERRFPSETSVRRGEKDDWWSHFGHFDPTRSGRGFRTNERR